MERHESIRHEYVRRQGAAVVHEKLFCDWWVRWLYSGAREQPRPMFDALTGRRFSQLLALLNYDLPFARWLGLRRFLERCGVDWSECLDPESLGTPRALFERRIRYWECRPLPDAEDCVVSPADARVVVGSLLASSSLWIKEKFFCLEELLGPAQQEWIDRFSDGDFAIFRLTPERYHYNHAPVSGRVADQYELDGAHHSCHPAAVVELVTPYSKNRRAVSVIDTDVPGGSQVGCVAMIEVVALMIGQVVQCYSAQRYEDPQPVQPGLFVERGQPKSLFRPGSSTVVLLFEPKRTQFCGDLVRNQRHPSARSLFSEAFGQPLVETDVRVRSAVAHRAR